MMPSTRPTSRPMAASRVGCGEEALVGVTAGGEHRQVGARRRRARRVPARAACARRMRRRRSSGRPCRRASASCCCRAMICALQQVLELRQCGYAISACAMLFASAAASAGECGAGAESWRGRRSCRPRRDDRLLQRRQRQLVAGGDRAEHGVRACRCRRSSRIARVGSESVPVVVDDGEYSSVVLGRVLLRLPHRDEERRACGGQRDEDDQQSVPANQHEELTKIRVLVDGGLGGGQINLPRLGCGMIARLGGLGS